MRTTTSMSTHSTPPIPSRMALPPPRFDLRDGHTLVGWIDGPAIGFRGFGNEAEAAHAAWVAYRTMARRFARDLGRRPPPIDTVPMSLHSDGTTEHILAGERPIASLVRPGADSRSGADSFGFEMQSPLPANELTMRSTAHLVYRAMRRSGSRWTMWTPARVDVPVGAGEPARAHVTETRPRVTAPRRADTPSATAFISRVILASVAAVAAVALVIAAPQTVTIPIAVALGGGLVMSGLVVAMDRWVTARRAVGAWPNRGARSRERTPHPGDDLRVASRAGEPWSASRWGALAALSMLFLVLALLAPHPIGAALAAVGLIGLLVFRIAAPLTGWPPRRATPVRT